MAISAENRELREAYCAPLLPPCDTSQTRTVSPRAGKPPESLIAAHHCANPAARPAYASPTPVPAQVLVT